MGTKGICEVNFKAKGPTVCQDEGGEVLGEEVDQLPCGKVGYALAGDNNDPGEPQDGEDSSHQQ